MTEDAAPKQIPQTIQARPDPQGKGFRADLPPPTSATTPTPPQPASSTPHGPYDHLPENVLKALLKFFESWSRRLFLVLLVLIVSAEWDMYGIFRGIYLAIQNWCA